ncbi:MAG: winged helix-turn-helix transcriptional regulator [Candidatus Eremiobacteraeota bacterium]|nr:winged helix-turn-helix transcriptional regulator [Candidatus Eremiobacteraeota bacterium]
MVNNQRLDAVFSALADPIRRRMVERLARRPLTVGELAHGFPISQPGISKHVKVLEEAGLLRRDIVGREHHCEIEPKAMEAVSEWLDQQRRFWNATLDRLETYLSSPSASRRRRTS